MTVTYKDAGVDIERGDALVDRIGPLAKRTHRRGVLAGVGGFGALFGLKELGTYQDPVLVTGCDGVGTKLKLAFMANEHRTVGIDLVAMSVNDILCHGAEPLFFLDYFATSKLDVDQAAAVIEGIAEGCQQAGCALVGGETAELPGFYTPGEYDLAGFAVGVAERSRLLPRPDVVPGDIILGFPSSGLHSNGYSLARRLIFDELKLTMDDELPKGAGPVRSLLTPTRIYVRDVLPVVDRVKAIAHITGGGLTDNVPRVLPPGTRAAINPVAWPMPTLFSVLQAASGLDSAAMFRTFNMGIGLVLVVGKGHLDAVMQEVPGALRIGEIVAHSGEPDCVIA